MIHLDTSFLIRALRPKAAEANLLRTWIRSGEPIGMTTVAWAEFICGPVDQKATRLADRIVGDLIRFEREDAERSAELFNLTGRRRGTLIDCMIAATALRRNASVATANPADFKRLQAAGLGVISA